MVVAVRHPGPVADADRSTEEAVTATRRDPAELLVVLMDERPGMVVDVADRDARRPVAVAQAAEAGPHQDLADGRARVAGERRQAVWPVAPADSGPEDRCDGLGRQRAGRMMGPRAPIEQAILAFGLKPPQPFVRRRPTDSSSLRRLGDRPALVDDPGHQELPTEHVETSPMLGHESLPTVWSFDTPNRARRLSAVNNVCGKYS